MDYDLQYHKELERKILMLSDNLNETTKATERNKLSILKLHYKLDVITIFIVFALFLQLPQTLPAITFMLHLLQ